jgi:putative acyl-CoA dehydrogenase
MTSMEMHAVLDERTSGFATHEVLNQPGALEDYNAYSVDTPLLEAVRVFGGDWAEDHLKRAGALVGSAKVQHLARQANRHLPELRTHDRFGHRVDLVEFHPAYHELMSLISTRSLGRITAPARNVARAVLSYLWNQGENGICCPMGMTFASIPALRHDPTLLAEWGPLINRPAYDPRARSPPDRSTDESREHADRQLIRGISFRHLYIWSMRRDCLIDHRLQNLKEAINDADGFDRVQVCDEGSH